MIHGDYEYGDRPGVVELAPGQATCRVCGGGGKLAPRNVVDCPRCDGTGVEDLAVCECGTVTGYAAPRRPADAPPIKCAACISKAVAAKLTVNYRKEAQL